MSVRLGSRRFAPTLLGTLLMLAVGVALLNLGFWQLRRAEEKRQLLAAFAEGTQQAVALDPATVESLPHYREITATGHYDRTRQVLLDNMPSARGDAGYQVLTPFLLQDSGTLLLVDRGWVSMGTSRAVLPEIAVDDRVRAIRGRLDELPRPGYRLGQSTVTATWPKVLNYPVYGDLAALFGRSLQRRIVLLDADQPDGYERHWQLRFGFGPERHTGYAVTWFALTLTLIVIYIIVNLEPLASNPSPPSQ